MIPSRFSLVHQPPVVPFLLTEHREVMVCLFEKTEEKSTPIKECFGGLGVSPKNLPRHSAAGEGTSKRLPGGKGVRTLALLANLACPSKYVFKNVY